MIRVWFSKRTFEDLLDTLKEHTAKRIKKCNSTVITIDVNFCETKICIQLIFQIAKGLNISLNAQLKTLYCWAMIVFLLSMSFGKYLSAVSFFWKYFSFSEYLYKVVFALNFIFPSILEIAWNETSVLGETGSIPAATLLHMPDDFWLAKAFFDLFIVVYLCIWLNNLTICHLAINASGGCWVAEFRKWKKVCFRQVSCKEKHESLFLRPREDHSIYM